MQVMHIKILKNVVRDPNNDCNINLQNKFYGLPNYIPRWKSEILSGFNHLKENMNVKQ